MCLPGNTLGAQGFISGPSGYVRDKVFGRGTSQKIVDKLDRVHRSTIGKVVGSNFDSVGFLPGSVPGPNKNAGTIDFKAEKAEKRRKRAEADKQSFLLANHGRPRPTILGG